MEAIVLDFKKSLKVNVESGNKNSALKSKDFSSTLESLNSKINNKDSSQNTTKLKEDKKTTISNKDEVLKENTEPIAETTIEPTEDDEKKDYSLAYGNMINFFNAIVDAEGNSVNDEEVKLSIVTNTESLTLEENEKDIIEAIVKDNEMFIEDKTSDMITREDKINKEIIPREFELTYTSDKINDDNVGENNLNNEELKFGSKILRNEVDEKKNAEMATISVETKSSHIEQSNDKMEFSSEQKHNFESPLFEQELDTIEVEKTDENLKINDESFISMEKNGINFIKDNFVQLDKPDVIDRKEVVQQIIDKVKIDLSDAKNEIRVTLKPEVLGEMTMNIEVVRGSVTAKIMVDNQRTKEVIEGNLMQLKEGIKDTGLEIKTVEVFVGNNNDFDKHNSGQFNFKQNNRKIKIKPDNNKAVKIYGEQPMENGANDINDAYLENNLNLFA